MLVEETLLGVFMVSFFFFSFFVLLIHLYFIYHSLQTSPMTMYLTKKRKRLRNQLICCHKVSLPNQTAMPNTIINLQAGSHKISLELGWKKDPPMGFNHTSAEAGIFWENKVNTVGADALAPFVTRSSTTLVVQIICSKWFLVFHLKTCTHPAPF